MSGFVVVVILHDVTGVTYQGQNFGVLAVVQTDMVTPSMEAEMNSRADSVVNTAHKLNDGERNYTAKDLRASGDVYLSFYTVIPERP